VGFEWKAGIAMKNLRLLAATAALLFASSVASADTVLATFSGGVAGGLQAQATFTTNGTDLFLVLTNTSTVASTDPGTTLTAVLFNGSLTTFNSVSPMVTPGSTAMVESGGHWVPFIWPSGSTTGDVGGEWALGSPVNSGSTTWTYGVSSSGLGGMFGDSTYPSSSPNLAPPDALDGAEFGLVSLPTFNVDPTSSLNGTNTPLVANSVTFNLGHGTTLGSVNSLLFVYGTGGAPFEASLPGNPGNPGGGNTGGGGVPLPKTAWAGIGLLGMLAVGRTLQGRRRQAV